jgi:hypothetical protein
MILPAVASQTISIDAPGVPRRGVAGGTAPEVEILDGKKNQATGLSAASGL